MKYCQTASAYTFAITPCDQKSCYDESIGLHLCLRKKQTKHCKLDHLDVELHDATPTLVFL